MDITEKKYLKKNDFDPEEYRIVVWAESQAYIGYTEDDDVYLINDEKGLDLFGSSAYVIPVDLEPYNDEFDNLSEDEVREMYVNLNDDFAVVASKLEETTKYLISAKGILDSIGYEGELMDKIDNFLK